METLAVTLDQLKKGQQGSVMSFKEGAGDILPRFYVMGLMPFADLQVMRRAPMGDPMIIKIANTRWSIRAKEAALINVQVSK